MEKKNYVIEPRMNPFPGLMCKHLVANVDSLKESDLEKNISLLLDLSVKTYSKCSLNGAIVEDLDLLKTNSKLLESHLTSENGKLLYLRLSNLLEVLIAKDFPFGKKLVKTLPKEFIENRKVKVNPLVSSSIFNG